MAQKETRILLKARIDLEYCYTHNRNTKHWQTFLPLTFYDDNMVPSSLDNVMRNHNKWLIPT